MKIYSAFQNPQIRSISSVVPAQHKGAFRDRHEIRVRDAVDARRCLDDSIFLRTAKARGSDTLTPVSSQRRQTADDGGNRAGLTGEIAYKP